LTKKLKLIKRKWTNSRAAEKETADVPDEGVELALLAYSLYMSEVTAALIKVAEPAYDIERNHEGLANAIKTAVDISKSIYSFIDMAENASKEEDRDGNLSDLVYLKVSDLQKMIDDELLPKAAYPVFEKYITSMIAGLPEANFDFANDLILTSNADVLYLKLVVKLIAETPDMHLEIFVW